MDDEAGIRESVGRGLERRGFLVETAATPSEALAILRAIRPAVAIIDIRMPSSDPHLRTGLDLLAHLRSQPEFAELPVIVLTGYALTPEEEAAARDRRTVVLYKPVSLGAIVDQVVRAAESEAAPNRRS